MQARASEITRWARVSQIMKKPSGLKAKAAGERSA
jgi:hypothetical protein